LAAKEYTHNGFTYWRRQYTLNGSWAADWFYRPAGADLDVQYFRPDGRKTLKADVEAFLAGASEANEHYQVTLARRGDVAGAEEELERAKARYEHSKSPDYDPGGNTNNPGKVARIIREDANVVPFAEARLADARRVAELMARGNKRSA
jgi:hypothetical protein